MDILNEIMEAAGDWARCNSGDLHMPQVCKRCNHPIYDDHCACDPDGDDEWAEVGPSDWIQRRRRPGLDHLDNGHHYQAATGNGTPGKLERTPFTGEMVKRATLERWSRQQKPWARPGISAMAGWEAYDG